MMDRDAIVNSTRRDLDEAVQKHIAALYGAAVSTDWIVLSEVVDEDDDKNLVVALSENCSAWKIRGMIYHGSKLIHTMTA